MINNRQAGRRRGRGNGQRQGGNPGRPDNGNRIDSRARGNANQLYEKYKNLASDAQRQGDRVNTEYYLQFADHYFRVLSESRGRFEEQGQRRQRDDNFVNGFDSDFDGDEEFGDEGESIRAGEQGGDEQPRREAGARNDGQSRREDGQSRREEGQPRRDEARRDGRRDREAGGERDGYRDGGRRGDRRGLVSNGEGREAADGQAVETAEAAPALSASAPSAGMMVANDVGDTDSVQAEPRRRGRPRRERPVETVEADAAVIEAERLPPSLSAGNDVGPAEDAPKPRRRRTRTVEGGEVTSAG
ncbi:protein of unknown function [Sphingomonas gellani]|uniref:DUF4167 domain-containing protein n=1 Tax=Sphingomonas gellani TaxID=1166340 RepID=A0A1H8ISU7_9SPHN|nr:DUF4167 domain-containing protein [Sphingomonas gellani]SEN71479.1 protein of unknown function [Sphingomonas gellani]